MNLDWILVTKNAHFLTETYRPTSLNLSNRNYFMVSIARFSTLGFRSIDLILIPNWILLLFLYSANCPFGPLGPNLAMCLLQAHWICRITIDSKVLLSWIFLFSLKFYHRTDMIFEAFPFFTSCKKRHFRFSTLQRVKWYLSRSSRNLDQRLFFYYMVSYFCSIKLWCFNLAIRWFREDKA